MFWLISSFITLAAILPSLAWLFFFLKEDIHPEPRRLIFYVFSLGALFTLPVIVIQFGFKELFEFLKNTPLAILFLALSEEVFKFLAAWWGVRREPEFDEPVDAMIYMVAAGLGFAAVENLFIIGGTLTETAITPFLAALQVMLIRFVGATLLHVLASALMGFYWAKRKILSGLLVATSVHAFFNYLILVSQNNNLLYAALLLSIAAFFVLQDFEKLKSA